MISNSPIYPAIWDFIMHGLYNVCLRLTMPLHDAEKFDDDLGGGSDEDLAFAASFGIDNIVLYV
jgi:hypothetical protein